MLTGAALFIEAYPILSNTILSWGRKGPITLPQIFGINEWIVIVVFVIAGLALFRLIEKKGL